MPRGPRASCRYKKRGSRKKISIRVPMDDLNIWQTDDSESDESEEGTVINQKVSRIIRSAAVSINYIFL